MTADVGDLHGIRFEDFFTNDREPASGSCRYYKGVSNWRSHKALLFTNDTLKVRNAKNSRYKTELLSVRGSEHASVSVKPIHYVLHRGAVIELASNFACRNNAAGERKLGQMGP